MLQKRSCTVRWKKLENCNESPAEATRKESGVEGLHVERRGYGESVGTAFFAIDSDSDKAASSTRRIAHQVAKEVLRTRYSVTPELVT